MNGAGNSNERQVKIGELLIAVNALTSGDLTEAIQISQRMGVPIGRVLVMSGCVSEQNLQQALELQSLIKDNMVDIDTGKNALGMVFKNNITLHEALRKLNWQPRTDASSNKLGDLLIDSNIVTPIQLDRALEASFQSGMPLGGTLVLQGVISAQLLPTILHVQDQIRAGQMTREDALGELKLALMFWARAEQSKQEDLQGGGATARTGTHTLKKTAAKVTHQGLKPAAQTGSYQRYEQQPPAAPQAPAAAPAAAAARAPMRPGETAVPPAPAHVPPAPAHVPPAPAHVPPAPAHVPPAPAAPPPVNYYAQPNYGTIINASRPTASHTKLAPVTLNAGGAPAQAPPGAPAAPANQVSLVELLKLSGYISQAQLEQALMNALADSRVASKVLLAIGVIDGAMLNNCVQLQALIARGQMRTDQALFVMNSIRNRNMTLESALVELGIKAAF